MESIFRQKNIDKISSPEQLNDYVKVTNPSVWIILIGALLLIVGLGTWGVFGSLETGISTVAVKDGNSIICYVDEGNIDSISSGMQIKSSEGMLSIDSIPTKPVKASELDEYALHKAGLNNEEWIYPVKCTGSLTKEITEVTITVEQFSPISFLIN